MYSALYALLKAGQETAEQGSAGGWAKSVGGTGRGTGTASGMARCWPPRRNPEEPWGRPNPNPDGAWGTANTRGSAGWGQRSATVAMRGGTIGNSSSAGSGRARLRAPAPPERESTERADESAGIPIEFGDAVSGTQAGSGR